MENTIYSLVEPKKIVAVPDEIDENSDIVVVKPTHLSICHADQRYYQGMRPPEILAKKLPMALIHECRGTVVCDSRGEFTPGQVVVMVPNTPFEQDDVIAENYLRSSKFRASGFDGFMQDKVAVRRDRVIPVPDGVDPDVAAFSEMCSVSYHVIDRMDRIAHSRRDIIGVWGEGNLGYFTALLLKKRFTDSKIYLFGVVEDKMAEFTFVDRTFSVNDIPEDVHVDHAFECVGGKYSAAAINQIIDPVINPEGTIALMGVSEDNVPLNTRMILERGLRLFGSSRSGSADFTHLMELYAEYPEVPELLRAVIGDVIDVRNIDDIHTAFAKDMANGSRKTVMRWEL